jgi:hypothetical protein
VALVQIVLLDGFILDELDIRLLILLLGVGHPGLCVRSKHFDFNNMTYVGATKRLILAWVRVRRLAASSVLK